MDVDIDGQRVGTPPSLYYMISDEKKSYLYLFGLQCYKLCSAGRIVIGLYGEVVPKTVGMFQSSVSIVLVPKKLNFLKPLAH